MAHTRSRWIEKKLIEEIRWSPVVGLFGLRQVGKTTLTTAIADTLHGIYETLDDDASKEAAINTPKAYCQREKLLIVDEAQKAPEMFLAIKQIIGTRRKPGQFFLTGSIRFTLKKAISEALTGRILMRELLPFNCAEIKQIEPSRFVATALNIAVSSKNTLAARKYFEKFISGGPRISESETRTFSTRGGMPISAFSKNDSLRSRWFQNYFETLISRDVPLVDSSLEKVSIRKGFSMLRYLAQCQGRETSISDLASCGGIDRGTASRFLHALESLSLIDLISPESFRKSATSKPRLEWKDFGLWSHFVGSQIADLGNEQAFELFLSQEFRSQISVMDPQLEWTFYKSRDLARIPWVFRQGFSSAVALSPCCEESPRPYTYRTLKRFVSENQNSCGILIGPKSATPTLLNHGIWLIPWNLIL